MGLQVVGGPLAVAAAVSPHGLGQALEETGHCLHVVARARQRADAYPVGLGLVGARVVDLALLDQPHGTGHGGLGGFAARVAASRLGQHDRAQHAQQDRNLVALRPLHAAKDVLLGDMGHFMREHCRHLVLPLEGEDQPAFIPI